MKKSIRLLEVVGLVVLPPTWLCLFMLMPIFYNALIRQIQEGIVIILIALPIVWMLTLILSITTERR